MEQLTPHEYIKELKNTIQNEYNKIKEQKELCIKGHSYEIASQWRDIEAKLGNFMNDINFKK